MSLLYWSVSFDSFQWTLLLQAFDFYSLYSHSWWSQHIEIHWKSQRPQQESARVKIGWLDVSRCLWGVQFGQAKTVYALTSLDGFTQPIQLKQSLGFGKHPKHWKKQSSDEYDHACNACSHRDFSTAPQRETSTIVRSHATSKSDTKRMMDDHMIQYDDMIDICWRSRNFFNCDELYRVESVLPGLATNGRPPKCFHRAYQQ